jgi:hypothetical protein
MFQKYAIDHLKRRPLKNRSPFDYAHDVLAGLGFDKEEVIGVSI